MSTKTRAGEFDREGFERLVTLAELAAYEPAWDDPALYRDWSLTGGEETT